jgi:hypothetical protein
MSAAFKVCVKPPYCHNPSPSGWSPRSANGPSTRNRYRHRFRSPVPARSSHACAPIATLTIPKRAFSGPRTARYCYALSPGITESFVAQTCILNCILNWHENDARQHLAFSVRFASLEWLDREPGRGSEGRLLLPNEVGRRMAMSLPHMTSTASA